MIRVRIPGKPRKESVPTTIAVHLPILRLALEEPRQVDEDGEDDDGRHVLEEPTLARLGAVGHRDIPLSVKTTWFHMLSMVRC